MGRQSQRCLRNLAAVLLLTTTALALRRTSGRDAPRLLTPSPTWRLVPAGGVAPSRSGDSETSASSSDSDSDGDEDFGCHEIPTSEVGGEIFLRLADGAEFKWWTEDLPESWSEEGTNHLCEAELDEDTVHGFIFIHMLGFATLTMLADQTPCIYRAQNAQVEMDCWSGGDFMYITVERKSLDGELNQTSAMMTIPYNGTAGPCDCGVAHRALLHGMKRLYNDPEGPWDDRMLNQAMSAVVYASDLRRGPVPDLELQARQQRAYARRIEAGEDIFDTLQAIGFFSLRTAQKTLRIVVPTDALMPTGAAAALQVASSVPQRQGDRHRRGKRRLRGRRHKRSAARAGEPSAT